MLDKAKILDSVKKTLWDVANVNSGFDLERWTLSSVVTLTLSLSVIEVVRVKQQLNAIKNSSDQVDVFQKQFVDDSRKRSHDNDEQMDKEAFVKKTRIKNTSSDENLAYGKS
nr:15052_t:CDS:2 [Entrophospora candida]